MRFPEYELKIREQFMQRLVNPVREAWQKLVMRFSHQRPALFFITETGPFPLDQGELARINLVLSTSELPHEGVFSNGFFPLSEKPKVFGKEPQPDLECFSAELLKFNPTRYWLAIAGKQLTAMSIDNGFPIIDSSSIREVASSEICVVTKSGLVLSPYGIKEINYPLTWVDPKHYGKLVMKINLLAPFNTIQPTHDALILDKHTRTLLPRYVDISSQIPLPQIPEMPIFA